MVHCQRGSPWPGDKGCRGAFETNMDYPKEAGGAVHQASGDALVPGGRGPRDTCGRRAPAQAHRPLPVRRVATAGSTTL